jgi:hypothetical protein
MERVGIFCSHLLHITDIGNILLTFGNLVSICYISPRFGILWKEKSGNPVFKVLFVVLKVSLEAVIFCVGIKTSSYVLVHVAFYIKL